MPLDNLEAYWLPFTPNRYFKEHPKMVVSAKGAYYRTNDGRELFDCLSGMWCCPLGHAHPKIVEAFTRQAQTLDYAPAFQVGSPVTFQLAERIAALAPEGLEQVFFVNSGSEAVDSALKIALSYHRARGNAGRFRMIGRERAYHGVGFGGISVGGMVANRKAYGAAMLPGVDHMPHTWNPAQMAFSKGEPTWGLHLVEELERIISLHDASSIAAVIVEPVQGSTGLIVPPAGYLKRLREICTRHGILLIFDEVITGFGRLGENFAAQKFDVKPDMITFAKAITSGTIPLGGVIVTDEIYRTCTNVDVPSHMAELFHGYTYSGHPMATAVGVASLDVYREEGLFSRAQDLSKVLETAVHGLKGEPGVMDIRNIGLAAAVELEPVAGKPGLRAFRVFENAFEKRHLFRVTGDAVAMAPPFIATPQEIEDMIQALRESIRVAFAN